MSAKASEQAKSQLELQFNEWKSHPVTQALFKLLAANIQERKDAWANGEMLSSFAHEQFIREAVAKGFIQGCEFVLSIEVKDFQDE